MPPEPRSKAAIGVVAMLFLAGVYAPTSIGRVISPGLQFANLGLLFVLLLTLALRRRGLMDGLPLVCSAAIPAVMLIATLLSPLTEFAYGAVLVYGLLAILLSLRLDNLVIPAGFRRLLLAVSLVNAVGAVLLLLQNPEARQFLLDNYSAAYPDLVPFMLDEGKPVLSFASHSIAGFYFYLFFLLNVETFRSGAGRLHLLAAVSYLLLMITLSSSTGYLFSIAGLLHLAKHFLWRRSWLKVTAAALALLLSGVVLATQFDVNDIQTALLDNLLRADSSGLSGRYSSTGALAGNLTFIAENPLQPIGLTYSPALFYGDSGPVEYLTRGSFPLLLAIYCGFYLFVRRNLRARGMSLWLFFSYLAFEAGYSNLNYFRSLYLLPFVVVYLNNLTPRSEATHA